MVAMLAFVEGGVVLSAERAVDQRLISFSLRLWA